jgi:hypothetical protein
MAVDVELELLRAARALCAWRAHVRCDPDETGFTCDDVLAFVAQTNAQHAFPRISHQLLAHVVEGIAESLAGLGFIERVRAGLYVLTAAARANLDREPSYLAQHVSLPEIEALPLRRAGR